MSSASTFPLAAAPPPEIAGVRPLGDPLAIDHDATGEGSGPLSAFSLAAAFRSRLCFDEGLRGGGHRDL
jgi:hypothetical protein